MVTQDRIAQNLDGHLGCQLLQLVLDPVLAVVVVPAGERVVPQEEGPADAPLDAVVDPDHIVIDKELARDA